MNSIIKNEWLTAIINPNGAELCSLKNTAGIEFIWQANKSFWPRHAPVLFPVVGKLKNDSYTYMGKSYSMPQHGCARDKVFEVITTESVNENEIAFRIQDDAETLACYPFHFELMITYKLSLATLTVSYSVKNNDKIQMPFSIGAHPGFNCPIVNNERFEDYKIMFSQAEKLETALLKEGLFSGEKKILVENGDSIKLDSNTFADDALVFQNLQSTSVTLKSDRSKPFIKLRFDGFPFLGIWSKANAPFVCLEPWFGKADDVSHDGNILDKAGIKILDPGQSFNCSFQIEVS